MASPYDLVSLQTVKDWLGLSSSGSDAQLTRLITQISRAVLTQINRSSILPTSFAETRDGNGQAALMLANWPVLSVGSLSVGGRAITAASGPLAGYVFEPLGGPPPGRPALLFLRCGQFPHGRQNVAIAYTAGYQVTAEAATVPGGGGMVTPAQPYGDWASDAGVTYASDTALVRVSGVPAVGQYAVGATGIYTFAAGDGGGAVLLTYGYVPADLANAALEWIADRWAYKGRVGYTSKTLGGQETVSFSIKAVPDFVKTALWQYTNVVPIC